MASEYTLCEASPADAKAIASLFSLSWTSPFTRLQFSDVDPPTLAADMAPRIEQHMVKPNIRFIVMRDHETQEVIAVAQWSFPSEEDPEQRKETAEEKAERDKFNDEVYRNKLPEKSNKDLIMEFTVGLRTLRKGVLKGRKHYRTYT